jgi:hypothetical protein
MCALVIGAEPAISRSPACSASGNSPNTPLRAGASTFRCLRTTDARVRTSATTAAAATAAMTYSPTLAATAAATSAGTSPHTIASRPAAA